MQNAFLIAHTSFATQQQAMAFARYAVDNKLAACVQIIPRVISLYAWQGQTEQSNECLLQLKTLNTKLEALEHALHAQHPYDTPEFILTSIEHGSQGYLAWLQDSLA